MDANDTMFGLTDAFSLTNALFHQVLWGYSPTGTPQVYLALLREVKTRIVRIRWLHEADGHDDVFVLDMNWTKVESWEIKKIFSTCSDVTEPPEAERPAGLAEGQRWWRRAAAPDASDGGAEGGLYILSDICSHLILDTQHIIGYVTNTTL